MKPQYERLLISHNENRETCGVRPERDDLDRLKLEVTVACNRFWGKPGTEAYRPTTDPGAGGFQVFHKNWSAKVLEKKEA